MKKTKILTLVASAAFVNWVVLSHLLNLQNPNALKNLLKKRKAFLGVA